MRTSLVRRHTRVPSGARARALAAILAGAAMLATPAALRAQQELGTVSGRVTDEGGVPIPGVSISAAGTGAGALTGGDGTYRFRLRAGRYELVARLIGYAPERDTVTVDAGSATARDFRLRHAATTLSAVAVVGSRGEARTVINSPVPIDVLTPADIKSTGRTETAQILQQLAPSVNFPRATISDGTDAVRPATLRSLGPDQLLVLINGKRRHTSALVNVNGSVGRGAAAVDLNAIPASMIERIEVLREGAAAQYGSDAIAGVINIVLKSTSPGELSGMLGQTATKFKGSDGTTELSRHDGQVGQAAINAGVSSGPSSFLHGGIEYRGRGYTNRSLGDPRPQSFQEATDGVTRTNATGPINHRQGDAATNDYIAFVNTGYSLGAGPQLYAFGGYGHREAEAAGFFRRGQDDRTVRSLWPNGFLPLIHSTVIDGSGTVGVKGEAGGLRYDLSSVYGRNTFDFDILHTNNVSLGNASPTEFYAGQLGFNQWTTNLDLFRAFDVGLPLRVGAGAEFRRDGYTIKPGEPASYANGGQPVLDATGNPTTKPGAVGSQVFPGFTPSDAKDASRHNSALYADVETDLTERLLVDLAGRYENYNDFGSTTNGRAAARFTIIPQVVLRGSAGTGFRAPSLGQSYFSSTATNFVTVGSSVEPRDVLTLPVAGADAQGLGAKPLRPEKSHNYGAGVALSPVPALGITVDFYQILISDRIVLSENFVGPQIEDYFRAKGRTVSGARFFTNAVDTKSGGVDVVANYGLNFGGRGALKLTAGYNRNQTKVTHVDSTPPELVGQQEVLFGRVERSRIEEGQPRSNVLASAQYDVGSVGFTVRGQRFGSVVARSTNATLDQVFGAKTITDVALSYSFIPRLTLTAGADNVFDVYPDPNDTGANNAASGGNSNFGIFPYNQFSPFGFNGRFLYVRAAYGL